MLSITILVAALTMTLYLNKHGNSVAENSKNQTGDSPPILNGQTSSNNDSVLNSGKIAVTKVPANFQRLPILYYHSIMTEKGNELRIPVEQFEEQMKYLYDNGFHVISLDQMYSALAGGSLPQKPVVITFDDGYEDNYTNAYRVMKKYNFTGSVFMVSNYVNGTGFLKMSQLQELQANGWIIGGHTANHIDLATVNKTEAIKELKESRDDLEKQLNYKMKYFAYPFGGYNENVISIIREDGYQIAFTKEKGWLIPNEDLLLLKRVYLYANMGMDKFIYRLNNYNY